MFRTMPGLTRRVSSKYDTTRSSNLRWRSLLNLAMRCSMDSCFMAQKKNAPETSSEAFKEVYANEQKSHGSVCFGTPVALVLIIRRNRFKSFIFLT